MPASQVSTCRRLALCRAWYRPGGEGCRGRAGREDTGGAPASSLRLPTPDELRMPMQSFEASEDLIAPRRADRASAVRVRLSHGVVIAVLGLSRPPPVRCFAPHPPSLRANICLVCSGCFRACVVACVGGSTALLGGPPPLREIDTSTVFNFYTGKCVRTVRKSALRH